MIIETPFDKPLEEDVAFEDVQSVKDLADILKESENLYKAYLYMKKLFAGGELAPKEYDFVATQDQRDFKIPGLFFTYAAVFTEGVKERATAFEIKNVSDGTLISFYDPKPSGVWINIQVYVN
jgi:hypothetical protein